METDMLRNRFQAMSEERDRVELSETSGNGYETAEGYVQEFVSSSPKRVRAGSGEIVQVETRRRTLTNLDGEVVNLSGDTTLSPARLPSGTRPEASPLRYGQAPPITSGPYASPSRGLSAPLGSDYTSSYHGASPNAAATYLPPSSPPPISTSLHRGSSSMMTSTTGNVYSSPSRYY